MPTSRVVLLFAITASLSMPAAGYGQLQPVKTICTTPTMDYCMGILGMDFSVIDDPSFWSVTIYATFFGAMLDPTVDTRVEGYFDIHTKEFGTYAIPLSGSTQRGLIHEGGGYEGTMLRPSSIDDLVYLEFGSAPPCGIGPFGLRLAGGRACHVVSVPEPAPWMVIVLGMPLLALLRGRHV